MKIMWRILRVLALAYVGVCGVLMLLENSLVYRPTKASEGWQPAPLPDFQDVEFASADGQRIHGWWLPCGGAGQAILYCHGNAGNLSHRGGSMAKLRELLKMHVLIFDFPGYGKSEGRPSEEGCYRSADAAYAFLTDGKQIDPRGILIYGASLGGGVAVDLAARKPHRALVLVKTFTSAPEAAAAMYPWLPVRWLMRNRFDNLSKIKSCAGPIFIGHGTVDRLVPFAQGKRLYEAANEPKAFFTLEGADHNDSLPVEFFEALKGFLRKYQ